MTDPTEARGTAITQTWSAGCKDCRRADDSDAEFDYAAEWSDRVLERGGSRSDRCPRHRRAHREVIRSIAVAYVDLTAIRSVLDRTEPTGPLGGLGPLPDTHTPVTHPVDLNAFEFGLRDADVLALLDGLTTRPGAPAKRVAVLEAGTGTGKSTFGPFRLMNPPPGAALRLTDRGPIVVTEPRIPAATGVAAFVGETLCFGHPPDCGRHVGPGFPVGFQISGNKNWDDACRLLYVTDGTMINWIREGRLARIGAVIVDEAHERSENIDLILALLRDQLPRYPHLRVIIASATIDKNLFVEYFGGEENVHYQPVPAVKSHGYGIPLFPGLDLADSDLADGLDDGIGGRFEGFSDATLDGTGETSRQHARRLMALRPLSALSMEEWVADRIGRRPAEAERRVASAVADQALRILDGTVSGDVLCFLPKATMIDTAVELIGKGVRARGRDDRVYPLLAKTPDATKAKALRPSRPGRRKVVVSSNLAETSLTVSGVRYVVDSGLICQSEWDPELARGSVPTIVHSQSGVRQRWGRVGRDAPGFVFPLYGLQQFVELMPRDTPAGSTRTSLEQFIVKLKAAGVDTIDEIVLPANFSHDNYKPDGHGQRSAARFTAEFARAKASLAATGAIDDDGDLTALGRELERASGSAEQAVAVMLADRLACVHEVAAALALLGGSLTGTRGLLQFDLGWPAAWRLHAFRCHQALAVGCRDDLDLALRIFTQWQGAADRETWARTWWVNHALLTAADDSVMETVSGLSPGMRAAADRPVDLRLLERTRGVLTRALALHAYVPGDADPSVWTSTTDPRSIGILGRYQLTKPSGTVIAFGRYRPAHGDGETAAPPLIISGLVEAAGWAVHVAQSPFELLEQASEHADTTAPTREQATLRWLRDTLPIGTAVDLAKGLIPLSGAAPYPGDLPDLDADDDEDADPLTQPRRRSGRRTTSDREADGSWGTPIPDGDVPEEEAAVAVVQLDEVEPEQLDDLQRSPVNEWESFASPAEAELVTTAWATPRDDGGTRGWVVGYDVDDSHVLLKMVPTDSVAPATLDGPTEPMGTDLTLTVADTERDYCDEFRVLVSDDGRRFFVHPKTRGLSGRDVGLSTSLTTGTQSVWTVVPGHRSKEPAGLSPLPAVRRVVENFQARHADGWLPAMFEPAATGSDGASLGPVARLTVPGLDAELSALAIPTGVLNKAGIDPAAAARVEVRLGPSETSVLPWAGSAEDLERCVSDHGAFLRRTDDGELKPVGRLVPLGTIKRLLSAKGSAEWQRKVWRFWLTAQQVQVLSMRIAGSTDSVQLPSWLHQAWPVEARRVLVSRHGLERVVSDPAGLVSLFGPPEAVAAACVDIAEVTTGILLRVPSHAAGEVVGRGGHRLDTLRQTPDVVSCEMRGSDLIVVARSIVAVDTVVARVRQITDRALGTLTLTPEKTRLFIGTRHSREKELLQAAGCASARQRGSTSAFDVVADNELALTALATLVHQQIDPAATMTDVRVGRLEVTDLVTGRPIEPAPQSPLAETGTPTQRSEPDPVSMTPPPPTLIVDPAEAPSRERPASPPTSPVVTEGRTVEDAVHVALELLAMTASQVSVEVLQTPEYGLLRRLKRPARVRVTPV